MTAPQPGLLARLGGPTGVAAIATAVLILFGVSSMILPALAGGGGDPSAAAAAAEPAPAATTAPATQDDASSPATSPSTAATTGKATPTVNASFNSGYEDRVVQLVNSERRKAKCEALRMHSQLRAAARSHSADMLAHDFTRSQGSDGSSPEDRVRKAGYNGFSGELVAKGGDAGDVVKSWLRGGDREILLDCATKSIGVGAAMRGRTPYWTVDTGRA